MISHIPHKTMRHHGEPEWIFPWRPLGRPLLQRALPLMLVGAGLIAAMNSLHIQVNAPAPRVDAKASVILAGADAIGSTFAARAIEGGPYPSRFDPAAWFARSGGDPLAQETPWQPPSHIPKLLDLPEHVQLTDPAPASQGKPVFPRRDVRDTPPPALPIAQAGPSLGAIAGLTADSLPESLPAPTAPLSPGEHQVLLRLRPDGALADVVVLDAALGEQESAAIRDWLGRLTFRPAGPEVPSWAIVSLTVPSRPIGHVDQPR